MRSLLFFTIVLLFNSCTFSMTLIPSNSIEAEESIADIPAT